MILGYGALLTSRNTRTRSAHMTEDFLCATITAERLSVFTSFLRVAFIVACQNGYEDSKIKHKNPSQRTHTCTARSDSPSSELVAYQATCRSVRMYTSISKTPVIRCAQGHGGGLRLLENRVADGSLPHPIAAPWGFVRALERLQCAGAGLQTSACPPLQLGCAHPWASKRRTRGRRPPAHVVVSESGAERRVAPNRHRWRKAIRADAGREWDLQN